MNPGSRAADLPDAKPPRAGLPTAAAALLLASFLGTLAGATAARSVTEPIVANDHQWLSFAVLVTCAAFAQLFVVITPRNQSYHCTLAFILPAMFVLPPAWLLPLCLIQHLPEWARLRYPWYIQTFNICNYTVNALLGWAAARIVMETAPLAGQERLAAAAVAAAITFVAANHLLLATMLKLARGHGYRESGLFTVKSLSTDLAVACCGVALVGVWIGNPWLATATVATLVLIQRSLSVPALVEETRLDPKTGLFNAAHFTSELEEELERSRRFERPLAVVMADLDFLRDINNGYGHLAGDLVLNGIAEVLREEVRSYDLAARFGGEEFAVLLPETTIEEARDMAERIRRGLANTRFALPGKHGRTIRATISCGVAGFPGSEDATALIAAADGALYAAKAAGRNRVVVAGEQPEQAPAAPPLAAV